MRRITIIILFLTQSFIILSVHCRAIKEIVGTVKEFTHEMVLEGCFIANQETIDKCMSDKFDKSLDQKKKDEMTQKVLKYKDPAAYRVKDIVMSYQGDNKVGTVIFQNGEKVDIIFKGETAIITDIVASK